MERRVARESAHPAQPRFARSSRPNCRLPALPRGARGCHFSPCETQGAFPLSGWNQQVGDVQQGACRSDEAARPVQTQRVDS